MESEETLSLEKQNSQKNISLENSSPEKIPPVMPNEKQTKSPTINIPENNQKPSNEQTNSLINLALKDLQLSREKLEKELEELSKKKEQIEIELKSSFSGQSDSIARKVKGFQEYLTGALQDLAQSAEQLELVVPPVIVKPSPLDETKRTESSKEQEYVPAVSDTFKPDENLIRRCFNQFLEQPDFYAEPWKLRRSLESNDIEMLEDWFFSMGGRGAQPSRGNRSKNALIAASIIAILGEIYGDQFQTLVLASQPERLGEWRRCLQDALGLNREDFGPNSGIVLFERSDGLVERADRLEERGELPFIIIDAAEINVEIPILQFPIWLAFAGSPNEIFEEDELL
ncbi:DUF3086 domain-containing protein [Prochlorococcus marinus]|uniref:DUF3086 domain-containing protein n=1 Tax=Prochlorococcus marinus XMU1408 TaxID=2213228 RepID=A0A318R1F8_PROMR|nr:DUF3086 domain-containing protein [Prochlorococcus marinus]MBW3042510.1 DUF3086 domain-containing protein [Prochlorococcus marinus str. XMU1408]PYE01239.1 DUF3086 domain-containing protein [Prochlorococcus marinus XMU1408]